MEVNEYSAGAPLYLDRLERAVALLKVGGDRCLAAAEIGGAGQLDLAVRKMDEALDALQEGRQLLNGLPPKSCRRMHRELKRGFELAIRSGCVVRDGITALDAQKVQRGAAMSVAAGKVLAAAAEQIWGLQKRPGLS